MKISDSSMGHAPWAALAIFSGVVATLASLAITYPAHSHARRGVLQSQTGKGITFSANLVLSGISILLGIVAAGRGPVAVVFPLSVGSNLLSNMILQLALGIAHYTKNMMTGTLVLATAVMILPDVGPSEVPVGFDAADVLERPAAVVFVACSFVCVGLGLSIILRGTVKDNNGVLLFIYTVVNGSATVLSTSISKLVQMHLSSSSSMQLTAPSCIPWSDTLEVDHEEVMTFEHVREDPFRCPGRVPMVQSSVSSVLKGRPLPCCFNS